MHSSMYFISVNTVMVFFFHKQDILKTDPGMEYIAKKTVNRIKPGPGV